MATEKLKILVKLPSRERPVRFFQTITEIVNNFSDKVNFKILASLDSDDNSMRSPEVLGHLKRLFEIIPNNIIVKYGKSNGKIHAVNRDIETVDYPWDILLVMSDDMRIVKPGVDEYIRSRFLLDFPTLDGCLHLNDGYTGQKLCTIPIIGRPVWERDGHVYHPAYNSLWADNEQTEKHTAAGRMKYYPEVYIKHSDHPANNENVKGDRLHGYNESFYGSDEQVYKKRKFQNFP
jgi:hypothetical protein